MTDQVIIFHPQGNYSMYPCNVFFDGVKVGTIQKNRSHIFHIDSPTVVQISIGLCPKSDPILVQPGGVVTMEWSLNPLTFKPTSLTHTAMPTSPKSKTTLRTRIIAAVAAVVLLAGGIGGYFIWYNSPANVFDRTIEMIEQRNEKKSSVDWLDIKDNLKKLGITEFADKPCAIDRDFIANYIEKHSFNEFFENLNLIEAFMRIQMIDNCDSKYATLDDCPRAKLETMLRTALDVAGIPVQCPPTVPAAGTPGYYSENSDKHPTFFEDRNSMSHYEEGDEDLDGEENEYLNTTYKPYYIETTYHGDYAVHHRYGHKAVGSKNGSASWTYFDEYYVSYMGFVSTDSYATPEEAIAEMEALECFVLDGATYQIYPYDTCGDASHSYNTWSYNHTLDGLFQ